MDVLTITLVAASTALLAGRKVLKAEWKRVKRGD